MPRKRDPNKQIRLRTKLDTAEQINDELRRTYRLQRNKQITAAEAKSWRELLVALRAGLPDPVERPKAADSGWTSPPIILSVPSGCFFSLEQIAKMKRGEDVIDIAQCKPVEFNEPAPLTINAAPGPFPRLVHLEESNHEPRTPSEASEAQLEALLGTMTPLEDLSHAELMRRVEGMAMMVGLSLEELMRMIKDDGAPAA